MRVFEREPEFLIGNGFLEKLEDLEYEGRKILASRLGYRITSLFVDRFLGRIFEMPGAVFPVKLLRPEWQDLQCFSEGVEAICEAQRLVALNYFEDGSVEAACPPIKAMLHIMAALANTRAGKSPTRLSGLCLPANRCFRASGIGTGCGRNNIPTSLYGSGILRRAAAKSRGNLTWRMSALLGYLEELTGTIGSDPSLR